MIGQLLDGRYKIILALSAGGFGHTYIAEDIRIPGNPKCVVKHFKPASNDPNLLATARRLFQREAETLAKLGNSEYIPRILAVFEENKQFYLVQEFIDGHPLSQELTPGKRLSESYVIALLQNVLPVLEFIHQQGVIHQDIKPDNIIRRKRDGKLVLIDFGAVKQVREAIAAPRESPLITQGRGKPRPNSDIYALGMIGIQALTGLYASELRKDPSTGEILWQHHASVSPGLAAVLTQMVRYHFKDRYQSAESALQALQQLANPSVARTAQATVAATTEAGRSPAKLSQRESPDSEQNTIPVLPPTPPVSTSPNKLQVLVGVGVAAVVGLVGGFTFVKALENSGDRTDSNPLQSEQCRIISPTVGETAKVRTQPSRDAEIKETIDKGVQVSFIRESGAFVEIGLPNGSQGWVFNDQIQPCF